MNSIDKELPRVKLEVFAKNITYLMVSVLSSAPGAADPSDFNERQKISAKSWHNERLLLNTIILVILITVITFVTAQYTFL